MPGRLRSARRSPAERRVVARPPKKREARGRADRPAITSYPMPAAEAVRAAERVLFGHRFVDRYLSALLARASAAVAEEINADIARRGMPINHWRILASLWDGGGLTPSDIAQLTLIKQPTVTRLVARLAADGLIRKAADPADRRLVRLSLTARGRAEVGDLIEMAIERQRRLLDGLDADQLVAALRHLIAFCAARRRKRPGRGLA